MALFFVEPKLRIVVAAAAKIVYVSSKNSKVSLLTASVL